ncbi:hypothetical protein BH11PAT1_BH11PAT1_0090 [soil metagenome]
MLYGIIFVVIGIIFRNWFSFSTVSGGDLSYFFHEQIVQYLNPPFMWETFRNLGFGGDSFLHQGVYFYNLPFGYLGQYFDYSVIERIIWFFPVLIAGFFAPIILTQQLRIFSPRFYPLASLIFLLNTYFFMIMGGGQITVVFGYLAIPFVFASFIRIVKQSTVYNLVVFSLLFSFLVACDFRYAYIFAVLAFLYTVFFCFFISSFDEVKLLIKRYFFIIAVTIPILLLTHAFWLLPYLSHYQSPTGTATAAYTSEGAVAYFSFATFENTLSLLHPFWPENIFGKVGFMKPEFFLIPLLAYLSLLFLPFRNSKPSLKSHRVNHSFAFDQTENALWFYILFFALVGILGAFLAKGAKPPFGEVYVWLFSHFPGFIMFRDPTKWYTLIALSYSMLIPFTIERISQMLQKRLGNMIKGKKFIVDIFPIFITLLLVFLLYPAISGQVKGTLKTVEVPHEYIAFKNYLLHDTKFSRVLWIPSMQRFSFYSDVHPGISGKDYFGTYTKYGVISALQKKEMESQLHEASVRYVILPSDTQKEMFIDDRKYDKNQYKNILNSLEKIPWLKKTQTFGDIVVFKIENSRAHFWSENQETTISSKFINPTEYQVTAHKAKKGEKIVFSEAYDSGWKMRAGNTATASLPFRMKYNSFILPQTGEYTATVFYEPQRLAPLGLIITGISLSVGIFLLIYFSKKSKKSNKFVL